MGHTGRKGMRGPGLSRPRPKKRFSPGAPLDEGPWEITWRKMVRCHCRTWFFSAAAYSSRDELMLGYISASLMWSWLLSKALQPFAWLAAPQCCRGRGLCMRFSFMGNSLKGTKTRRNEVWEEEAKTDKPARASFFQRKRIYNGEWWPSSLISNHNCDSDAVLRALQLERDLRVPSGVRQQSLARVADDTSRDKLREQLPWFFLSSKITSASLKNAPATKSDTPRYDRKRMKRPSQCEAGPSMIWE